MPGAQTVARDHRKVVGGPGVFSDQLKMIRLGPLADGGFDVCGEGLRKEHADSLALVIVEIDPVLWFRHLVDRGPSVSRVRHWIRMRSAE